MILPEDFHTPVLLSEVIAALRVEKGKKYIDATLGGGGYAFEIVRRGGIVLGIDQDQEAIEYVKERMEDREWKVEERKNLYLAHGNFKDLKKIAHSNGFDQVAGIVFDLGMSSYQLQRSGRGFSYQSDEPLDMRMDVRQKLTAADILNNYSCERLYEIFTKYSEELNSRAIADAIVFARSIKGKLTRTSELSQLLDGVGTKARIFQALRIAVNNELENLKAGLAQAIDLVEKGGRICVLSYHSLEDRLVKRMFGKATSKPIQADRKEEERNPRARSAKLRIVEKVAYG